MESPTQHSLFISEHSLWQTDLFLIFIILVLSHLNQAKVWQLPIEEVFLYEKSFCREWFCKIGIFNKLCEGSPGQ